jgi:hypothetical protein
VMQSVESFDGLTCSDIGSHIFKALDDGKMGLHFIDMVMVAHVWERSPNPRNYTPNIIMHWMEDVALVDDWMECKYEIHPPPPWTLGLFYDDVILWFDGYGGVCFPHGHHMTI